MARVVVLGLIPNAQLLRLLGRDRCRDLADTLDGAGDECLKDGAVDREPFSGGAAIEKGALIIEADLKTGFVFACFQEEWTGGVAPFDLCDLAGETGHGESVIDAFEVEDCLDPRAMISAEFLDEAAVGEFLVIECVEETLLGLFEEIAEGGLRIDRRHEGEEVHAMADESFRVGAVLSGGGEADDESFLLPEAVEEDLVGTKE